MSRTKTPVDINRHVNCVQTMRKSRSLTQRQVAVALGISAKHLWMIESDRQHPSLGLLMKLSDILACSLDDLYSRPKQRKDARAAKPKPVEQRVSPAA